MSDPDLQNPKQMKSGQARHERPIWIWDCDTAGFVWANGEGVKFWSAHSLERLQAMPFDKAHPAWVTINKALASDIPLKGVDLDLHFPNGNGGMDCLAICRWGTLKSRRAIIVELLGMSATSDERLNGYQHEKQSDIINEDEAFLPGMESTDPSYSIHVPINGHDLSENHELSDDRSHEAGRDEQPLSEEHSVLDGADENGQEHKTSTMDQMDRVPSSVTTVPLEQLNELAKLIKQAGGTTEDVLQAAELHNSEASLTDQDKQALELTSKSRPLRISDTLGESKIHKVMDHEVPTHENQGRENSAHEDTARENWGTADLDMVALAGVGDQDELETILDKSSQPIALISLQKVLYANPEFVAEFGYGDLPTLINDGSDWLFPHSRQIFKQALETPVRISTDLINPRGGNEKIDMVRLRSGRKLKRAVLFEPIRLTKFDRTLLLIRLVGAFCSEDDVTGSVVSAPAFRDQKSEKQPNGLYSISMMNAVNHEVRTPLNVIIGFSELMIREQFGALGHEKYQGYVQDIHTSAQHALSLINDLLDLTKLQAGKWVIETEEVDINEITRQQVRLMRELAARAGMRFYSELEENLPLVLADERSLKQILLNLISNAIKFNSDDGRITVATVRLDETTVCLSVSDTGSGMTAPNIRKALQPFQQVVDEKTSDRLPEEDGARELTSQDPHYYKGTGLGLPIAKALAEANNMTFQIESKVGQGTKISLLMKV